MDAQLVATGLRLYVAWMAGGPIERRAYLTWRDTVSFDTWEAVATLYDATIKGIGQGRVLHGEA